MPSDNKSLIRFNHLQRFIKLLRFMIHYRIMDLWRFVNLQRFLDHWAFIKLYRIVNIWRFRKLCIHLYRFINQWRLESKLIRWRFVWMHLNERYMKRNTSRHQTVNKRCRQQCLCAACVLPNANACKIWRTYKLTQCCSAAAAVNCIHDRPRPHGSHARPALCVCRAVSS